MNAQSQTSTTIFPPLVLAQLYPKHMSFNGDAGNLLVLMRRMQWRNIPFKLVPINPGDSFPKPANLILGGGAEITEPTIVSRDLLRIKEPLRACIEAGAAALAVGGSYQLFGKYLTAVGGQTIEGLGVFNAHTHMSEQRLTGKVVAQSEACGTIVGFENHSGLTYLNSSCKALAQVTQGAGNNADDKTEGAQHRNALGTYLAGPLLPKNPAVADLLILKALEHRLGKSVDPKELAPLLGVDGCATQAALG